jgi:hypothetical protein
VRHPYLIQTLIEHQGKVLVALGGSVLEPLKKDTTSLIGRTMPMLYRGVVAVPGVSAHKELRMLQKKLCWYIYPTILKIKDDDSFFGWIQSNYYYSIRWKTRP